MIDKTDCSFLLDTDTGIWKVETTTSTYVLNLNARTGTRTKNNEHISEDDYFFVFEELRKDGEVWHLANLDTCMISFPMRLYARDINDDQYITTLRTTTPVQRIVRLETA